VATTGASNVGDWVDWVVDSSTGMPALGSSLPETGVTNQTNGNTTPAGSQYEPDWMRIPWATAVNGTYDGEHCVAVFGDSLLLGGNDDVDAGEFPGALDRKSTRLNSSHVKISYAAFCLEKKTLNDGTVVI